MEKARNITRRKTPQSEAWNAWEVHARDCLVNRMKQRKLSYKELSRRLEGFGIDESPDRLNRKVNRKRFSAAFFLACCEAMTDEVPPVTEKE